MRTEPSQDQDIKMAPTNLSEVFENIDATDLSQGVCSPRVQCIINEVHCKKSSEKTISVGDYNTSTERRVKLYELPATIGDWQLFATETGELGAVAQTIYFGKANMRGAWEAIPIFTMLERANDNGCSVSLCLPATDATDLEWGMVCTTADEGRPVTVDESLKKVPQTNANVLDELISILQGSVQTQKTNLLELIHIDELHKRAFPIAPIDEQFVKLNPETINTRLARRLRDIGEWTMLAAESRTFRETTVGRNGFGVDHIRFTPVSPDRTDVERITSNLGTKKKTQMLGRIVVGSGMDLSFQPDPELEAHFSNPTATDEIIRRAADTYGIKEQVTDTKLCEDINDMIADLIANSPEDSHSYTFSHKFRSLIEVWCRTNGDKLSLKNRYAPLNIGQIDISRLGPGEYFDYYDVDNLPDKLIVSIKANKSQSVFVGYDFLGDQCILRLHECSVDGAGLAFSNVEDGIRLTATNCTEAFINSDTTESVAENVASAFIGGRANACIAQTCGAAFDRVTVTNSLAVHCGSAFTHIDDRGYSHDLIAEYCGSGKRSLFTDESDGKISKRKRQKNNLVIVKSTKRSPVNNYRAGKRYGPLPDLAPEK